MSKNEKISKNEVIGVCIITIILLAITLTAVLHYREDPRTDAQLLQEAYDNGMTVRRPYETDEEELDRVLNENHEIAKRIHRLLREQ